MTINVSINLYEVLMWYLLGCGAMILLSAFSIWNYHRRRRYPFRLRINTVFHFIIYVALSWLLFVPSFIYFTYQIIKFLHRTKKEGKDGKEN